MRLPTWTTILAATLGLSLMLGQGCGGTESEEEEAVTTDALTYGFISCNPFGTPNCDESCSGGGWCHYPAGTGFCYGGDGDSPLYAIYRCW